MDAVLRTDGELVDSSTERRLRDVLADSPLNDEALTVEEAAAVDRLMASLRDE